MRHGLLFILSMVFLSACSEQSDGSAQSEANETNPTHQEADNASVDVQIGGADLYAIACQACHSIAPGEPHRVGPNLNGIVDAAAASREGYTYSTALQNSELTWNKANLTTWIVTPESLVPGTWMLYHNILVGEEVPRLIEYIEQAASPDQL